MAFTPNMSTTLLLLAVLVVLLPVETYAFGAGDIPDFAYLNDKAYRHGDIESILEQLVKSAGGLNTDGGLLGFASSVLQSAAGGAKFSKSDVKKVYFGNWLRDYSQCMDIAGLSKLTADTLVLVVSVLGFVTFGFATEEFQVTADRLGVYLPVEHIDNPKGYAAREGDARNYHPKLRPPVEDRELEIDERTGMKNYMASENQGWDTSTAFIRRTFRACIEIGRRARGQEGGDLWEAYRLLGTGLHTLEDLMAHSNWCEIALRKLGHDEVFCHVGDDVIVNTPQGPAPPLVTGTFGGADFIYSLMGEATDKLSSASVTEITQKMNDSGNSESNISKLKDVLSKLSIGGGDDKVSQSEQMNAAAKAYNFDPDNVAPPEVQKQLLDLLKWRDQIYRDVLAKIEMVPGLVDLIDELTNALNAYVYTILSPYIVPLLQQATGVLGEGSKAVVDSEDQYEVFDNPNASDPSHSFLSKDHFDLILNEPAGKIAQLIVQNSVNLIVQAWADNSNPDEVITQILEAFHHPYYATGRSEIQRQMFDHMDRWIGGLGHEASREIIQRLTKESVRNARNKRPGSENESHDETHGHGHSHSHGGATYSRPSGQQGHSQYGGRQESNQYGRNNESHGFGNQYGSSGNQYGSSGNQYGSSGNQYGSSNTYSSGRNNESSYGSSGNQHSSQYGSGRDNESRYSSSGNQHSSQYSSSNTYGSGRADNEGGYGSRNEYSTSRPSYGDSQGYGQIESRRSEDKSSGYGNRNETRRAESDSYYSRSNDDNNRDERHGRSQHDEDSYGSRRNENEYNRNTYGQSDNSSNRYGSNEGRSSYGSSQQQESYSSRRSDNDDYSSGRNQGYGQESSGYGYNSGGRRDEDHEESKYHRRKDSDDSDKDRRREGGYNPSYGGEYNNRSEERSYGGSGYGRSDETYGVERLRVGRDDDDDDDDDDEKRRRRHHRKRDSD